MRIILKKTLLAAALVLAALLPSAAARAETEAIESFDSAVGVGMDGRITVVETIVYRFPEPRHGIYRDLPLRYDEDGKLMEAPVTVLGVTDEAGRKLTTNLERGANVLTVRIGDPYRTITGTHTYVIRYRVDGALKYFNDHDELYWNATGTGWTVPILKSSSTVTLPDAVPADSIKVECYVGPQGSGAQDCLGVPTATGATFDAVGPLTIVVGWKQGIVARLDPREIKPPFYVAAFSGYIAWVTGLLGRIPRDWVPTIQKFFVFLPIIVPLWAFRKFIGDWKTSGKDPRGRDTLVVEYSPPDGITPAEIEALIDERAENKGIWATIIDLAVKGFLTIKEVGQTAAMSGTDFEFTLLKDEAAIEALMPHEKLVLRTLMGKDKTATLSAAVKDLRFYGKTDDIRTAAMDALVSRGYYDENPAKVRGRYSWMAAMVFAFGFVIGLPYLFTLFSPGWEFLFAIPVLTCAAGLLGLVLSPYMTRRTVAGVSAYERSVGFKEYLEKAERYRSRWQAEQGIFEKMLPYAVAFGVVDKWSSAFENENVQQPGWYDGRAWHDGKFSAHEFNGSLSSMRTSIGSAVSAAPAPSSSGSGFSSGGGGGHSGGGHGGGGGGSW